MSSRSFKKVINIMCLHIINLIYRYKEDSALNYTQELICHKIPTNRQYFPTVRVGNNKIYTFRIILESISAMWNTNSFVQVRRLHFLRRKQLHHWRLQVDFRLVQIQTCGSLVKIEITTYGLQPLVVNPYTT